jgi:glycine betaine/proline transport system permease protein
LRYVLVPLEGVLRATPPWAILIAVGLLTLNATRRIGIAGFFVLLLYVIGCFGLWDKLMQTLALMLVATVLSVVLGVPLGIWASRSPWMRRVLLPVLDIMQTLPSFVYLIPVLMLFGLGKVPAILATIIYALPPLIRLTDLGIRHVDADVVEAARAFGTTRWQLLVNVQLPLARPSIMAGINQTTMMALSMVVIASMIGSRGLGEDVLAGIQTLDIGKGMQAGIAIVILAIVIDRISQGYGQDRRTRRLVAQRRRAKAASRVPYRNAGVPREDEASAAGNENATQSGLETRTAD